VIIASFTIPVSLHAQATPILNFDKNISEWSLTSGFIYLHDDCRDSSPETTAYIQRRAVESPFLATLQSINNVPLCRTFRHAVTDESGIYYYNRNLGRLEAIYSDRPNDPPTPLATIGDWGHIYSGHGISNLRVYGSSVYWIESVANGEFEPDDISIKRVPKAGGIVKTMISYSTSSRASADGLGVTGSDIWWTDNDGLNRTNSCIFTPCVPGPASKEVEFSLAASEGHIELQASGIYWWSDNESPQRIRRTSCSRFTGNCSTTTLHTTSNGTDIAGLSANSTTVFWVEFVTLVGNRLRRKAVSNGTAETLLESISRSKPYLDPDFVYFQSDENTISRLFLAAQPIIREFGINAWEVTQGLQRPANDVPLVAGKPTFVRLYPTLDDGQDAGSVFAALHGSRDGQPLPGSPIYPLNVSIPVTSTLTLASRETEDGGWLFRLPESWTRTGTGLIPQQDTTITLRAVVDPSGAYADTDNTANNEIEDDFLFTAKAPTCMRMRPVATATEYEPTTGINMGQVVALTESMLPTAHLITLPSNNPLREIKWCWKNLVYGPFCSTPYELSDDDSLLLAKMTLLDSLSSNPDVCVSNNARTLYAGIIHQDAEWDWGGLARTGKDQLLTKIPKYGQTIDRFNGTGTTMAHEIGHNYNRLHVNCGDPKNTDTNYPYPTDKLDFAYSLGHPDLHFGFDPILLTPIDPGLSADVLSYCGPDWYSDYTWKAIFNRTLDPIYVPNAAQQQAAAGNQVRIAGVIDVKADTGILEFVWSLPTDNATKSSRQAPAVQNTPDDQTQADITGFHVQLLGNGDSILLDQPVELFAVDDGFENQPQPFELLVDEPAVTVRRVVLMRESTVIAELQPGVGLPIASMITPAGGENIGNDITVSWTASDPDGDDLLFSLLYSHDNGDHWIPLLANFGSTGEAIETVTLGLSTEPGSVGPNALVRVLVSDGYNTAFATSLPFSVQPRAPYVSIIQPAENQVFAAQQTVPLQSHAGDPEDGLIANNQFFWSTGNIGRIAEVRGLAPGLHQLDLVVSDSDTQEGEASVTFQVAPLAVPESSGAYVLDGRCDEPDYQQAPRLPLTAYSGGARASARIIHTSGSLWLCLSGLQGSGGHAGLLLDADNSRNSLVQADDFGYFVTRDGVRFVNEGNGVIFETASPDNLSARIFDQGTVWSAELRISRNAFGDWRRRVSLAIGHFGQSGGTYNRWPFSTSLTSPQTWALSNFGLTGTLEGLVPKTAVLGSGDINLTVSGSGFDSDARVLWNGTKVATTLVNAASLTAVVPASLASAAGIQSVSVGLETSADIATASLPFTVVNPQPLITSLLPESVKAGTAGMTMDINGVDFVDGARVIWNGEQRDTIFVTSDLLRIDLSDSDLQSDGQIPLTVLNPEPQAAPSGTVFFSIVQPEEIIFIDGFE
jgi:hypothetical protein